MVSASDTSPTSGVAFSSDPDQPSRLVRIGRGVRRFIGAIISVISTVFTLGLSLLPLTALLVALPAVSPNEAVLSDTVRPARTWFTRSLRRIGALFAGAVVLIALLAFAVELVTRLPLPENGQFAPIARKILGITPSGFMGKTEEARELALEKFPPAIRPYLTQPIWKSLPPAMVHHWPIVMLVMYAADLGLLLVVGRVPLSYNLRNLWVRRRISAVTALAFTVVVALIVALLGFVNGMNKVNSSTGVPGNVFVLSDGATDELFSNLGYGDVGAIERERVALDPFGNPIPPFGVKQAMLDESDPANPQLIVPPPTDRPTDPKKRIVMLASKENYFVMSQEVKVPEGEPKRRRFLQVRAVEEPLVAGAVHDIDLQPGGKWFSPSGVREMPTGEVDAAGKPIIRGHVEAVLGSGAAATLGPDAGKERLEVGDTFRLGDIDWVVKGLMSTKGTTFASEVWVRNIPFVTKPFGKDGKFTTLVLRTEGDTLQQARTLAFHLTAANNRYTQQKLKAYAEPDYYAELTKTNEQFLSAISMIALIMAIGGVFGVMNTMFASISARIREVGVLRILGFKRWQILISFMLESLLLAAIGGALGCALGYLANGYEAKSTLSGGQGGGKTVALTVLVDYQTLAAGMLFTLVMGRLGGLVPALSAMRMEILDSLR